MDFDSLLNGRAVSPGVYTIDFPDGWKQGRGLFGGLVIGALVRQAEHHAQAVDRQARSVTAELVGPAQAGPTEIRVRTLRAGNAVSTIAAELIQAGETFAHAVVVFGATRPVDADFSEAMPPEAPAWQSLEPFPPDVPFVPEFAKNFEFRNVGPAPYSAGLEALASGWVRPRTCSRASAAYVVAQADAWWPSFFTRMSSPRPIGTIAFSLQLTGALPEGDAPLFHRGRTTICHAGYATEQRELWTETGKLVSLNQQTIAIIK